MGEPLYSLYIHKFPNGKVYIGITKRTLEQRFKFQGKGYVNQTFMYRAIQKYGWDNIGHYLLADRLLKQIAIELEKQLISKWDSANPKHGYNIDYGGTTGCHSPESIRKAVEHRRWYKAPDYILKQHAEFMKGNQYNKGNHHTEEFKKWKSKQMHEKYKDGNNPRCKVVHMLDSNGNEVATFKSLRECAKVLGLSPASICKRIKEHSYFNECFLSY